MCPQGFAETSQSMAREQDLMQVHIALDATPHSTLVAQNLHRFINHKHSNCSFVYVIPDTKAHEKKFSAFDEEAKQEITRVVNEEFDQYAKTMSAHQFVISERFFIDNVTSIEDGVIDHVEETKPDLLVIGRHETPAKRKGWRISSTSYSIATHVPSSVMVIKNPIPKASNLKVLFATDGSSHADKAASELIRILPKETVDIYIISAVSINYYVVPVVEPYVDYTPLERAMQGEAVELLERTRRFFESSGFNVANATFSLGDPVDQILLEDERDSIDLIVVGSHGTGGRLAKWLLGSVSSKVLEYSKASVAILR